MKYLSIIALAVIFAACGSKPKPSDVLIWDSTSYVIGGGMGNQPTDQTVNAEMQAENPELEAEDAFIHSLKPEMESAASDLGVNPSEDQKEALKAVMERFLSQHKVEIPVNWDEAHCRQIIDSIQATTENIHLRGVTDEAEKVSVLRFARENNLWRPAEKRYGRTLPAKEIPVHYGGYLVAREVVEPTVPAGDAWFSFGRDTGGISLSGFQIVNDSAMVIFKFVTPHGDYRFPTDTLADEHLFVLYQDSLVAFRSCDTCQLIVKDSAKTIHSLVKSLEIIHKQWK